MSVSGLVVDQVGNLHRKLLLCYREYMVLPAEISLPSWIPDLSYRPGAVHEAMQPHVRRGGRLAEQAEADRRLAAYDLMYGVNMALAHTEEIFLGDPLRTFYRGDGEDVFPDAHTYVLPVVPTVAPEQTIKDVLPAILEEMARISGRGYPGAADLPPSIISRLKQAPPDVAAPRVNVPVHPDWNLGVGVRRGDSLSQVFIALEPRITPALLTLQRERAAIRALGMLTEPVSLGESLKTMARQNYQIRTVVLTMPPDYSYQPAVLMEALAGHDQWEQLRSHTDLEITGRHYAYTPDDPQLIAVFRPKHQADVPVRLVVRWDSPAHQTAQIVAHRSQSEYDATESEFRQYVRPAIERQMRAELALLERQGSADFSLDRMVIPALASLPPEGPFWIRSPRMFVGWTRTALRDLLGTYSDVLQQAVPPAVAVGIQELRWELRGGKNPQELPAGTRLYYNDGTSCWTLVFTADYTVMQLHAEPAVSVGMVAPPIPVSVG